MKDKNTEKTVKSELKIYVILLKSKNGEQQARLQSTRCIAEIVSSRLELMHNIFILADSGYKRWNEEKRGATGNNEYIDDIGFKTKQVMSVIYRSAQKCIIAIVPAFRSHSNQQQLFIYHFGLQKIFLNC
ncbi:hypothetical protein WUBG_07169 [Wuchereria bancrofti]|uniref:Uncharacterized protein n=1 Tax=Wuchereria bancrofti TaxID=6293 RepID=J9EHG2_WUCBA|nr:hypothetical protein WUBG_07169 [Wuchereria bancrofti]VDM19741.1 unnamed protein product [Wuchereria bancrofti]